MYMKGSHKTCMLNKCDGCDDNDEYPMKSSRLVEKECSHSGEQVGR